MEYKMRDYRFSFGNMIFDLYLSTLIICISDFSLLNSSELIRKNMTSNQWQNCYFGQFCKFASGWVSEKERVGWISLRTFNKTFFTFQTYVSKDHPFNLIRFYIAALRYLLFCACFRFRFDQWIFVYFVCIIPFHWTETRLDKIIWVKTKQHELCDSIDSKLQFHVEPTKHCCEFGTWTNGSSLSSILAVVLVQRVFGVS